MTTETGTGILVAMETNRDIDALIDRWWTSLAEYGNAEKDPHVESELLQRSRELAATIERDESALLDREQDPDHSIVLELRRMGAEVVALPGQGPDREKQFTTLLRDFLPSLIKYSLRAAYGRDWEFPKRAVLLFDALLLESVSKTAIEFALLLLDPGAFRHRTREGFQEHIVQTILAGKLFPNVRGLLRLLDPAIESHWVYERRTTPGLREVRKYFAPSGRHILITKRVEVEGYRLEYSTSFPACYTDAATGKEVDLGGEICALRWVTEDKAWVVLNDWAPLTLDFSGQTFTPDSRRFIGAEGGTRPLTELANWIAQMAESEDKARST